MHDLLTIIPWLYLAAAFFLGTGIAGSGFLAYLKFWQYRNLPEAEVEKVHSETELNRAQVRDLDLRGRIAAGEVINKLFRTADTLERRVINLQSMVEERDQLVKKLSAHIVEIERENREIRMKSNGRV